MLFACYTLTVLSIVLNSGLFSSNTQLGVIGCVYWGVKQLTQPELLCSLTLMPRETFGSSQFITNIYVTFVSVDVRIRES